MLRPLPKLLLVFNLDGTLCQIKSKQISTIVSESSSLGLSLRPDLESFLRFLFIRNKLYFKISIWSSLSSESTETLSKQIFSGFNSSLLFKYASPDQKEPRDLQRIWHNYPEFTIHNTVYIDSYKNSVVPKDNLLLMPKFSNDECLKIFQDYVTFFSYQYQERRVETFQEFLKKVPFITYFYEHTKPDAVKPKGESSRFW